MISRGGEDNYENISRHHDASLIVNTTPVGMYPNNGAAPVSLEGFTRLKLVIDLIYNPQRTALVLDAESRGIEARGGLLMLVAQGKLASELFTDSVISSEHMNKAFGTLEQGMKNIVLIGMPGCGKTTIGRRIAELAGRSFFDSDEEYERIYGVGAGESIRNCGEKAFRQEESLVLSELCKKSESVIATGGGVVTVKENYNIMHQNSTIVYLERELCELCGEDRPLSQSLGVEALYAARRDAYERMCDFKVKVDGADKTANEVLARIGMKH